MSIPAEIPGIGSTSQKPVLSPTFDPMRAGIGPEEYFVMSRIDGVTSLRDIIVTTGLPVTQAITIVTKLRALGAWIFPGEAPPKAAAPAAAMPVAPAAPVASGSAIGSGPIATRAERAASEGHAPLRGEATAEAAFSAAPAVARGTSTTLTLDVSLPDPTEQELAILAAEIDMTDTERRSVLALARRARHDPWTVLGVEKGTELSELKKVYFRLSKEVHPDRYYGKRLGPMADVLAQVFEAVRRAYTLLTDAKKQRERPASASSPQAPAEHAVELYERACASEVGGDLSGALLLFAASLRVDPQLRVFRRAANCALSAKDAKLALEYAKKAQALAPDDPSCARLLARAYRASEQLQSAEEVLVFALALPIDNDVLMAELRADLAAVRKQLTR